MPKKPKTTTKKPKNKVPKKPAKSVVKSVVVPEIDDLPTVEAVETGAEALPVSQITEPEEVMTESPGEELAAQQAISEQPVAPEERSEPIAPTRDIKQEPGSVPQSNFSLTPTVRSRFPQPKKIWAVVAAVVLIVGAALIWSHNHSLSDTERANKALIAEVAARAVLPKDEQPGVTTVTNKNKVSQPFLSRAENGDKVLLYFQSGRAVVYRPSTHQIVNMGPLSEPTARIFLRNGTRKDIPASVRSRLQAVPQYHIVSQDTAVKRTYTQTLVIDVSGHRPDLALRIAALIGAKVSALPAGETTPDADFLVIVGADAQ